MTKVSIMKSSICHHFLYDKKGSSHIFPIFTIYSNMDGDHELLFKKIIISNF